MAISTSLSSIDSSVFVEASFVDVFSEMTFPLDVDFNAHIALSESAEFASIELVAKVFEIFIAEDASYNIKNLEKTAIASITSA